MDVLILNAAGNPLATGQTIDPIGAQDLHVTSLDPANLIALGDDYQVGLEDRSQIVARTCTALAGTNATFTR